MDNFFNGAFENLPLIIDIVIAKINTVRVLFFTKVEPFILASYEGCLLRKFK